jgi:hypothetical protein
MCKGRSILLYRTTSHALLAHLSLSLPKSGYSARCCCSYQHGAPWGQPPGSLLPSGAGGFSRDQLPCLCPVAYGPGQGYIMSKELVSTPNQHSMPPVSKCSCVLVGSCYATHSSSFKPFTQRNPGAWWDSSRRKSAAGEVMTQLGTRDRAPARLVGSAAA